MTIYAIYKVIEGMECEEDGELKYLEDEYILIETFSTREDAENIKEALEKIKDNINTYEIHEITTDTLHKTTLIKSAEERVRNERASKIYGAVLDGDAALHFEMGKQEGRSQREDEIWREAREKMVWDERGDFQSDEYKMIYLSDLQTIIKKRTI